MRWLAEIWIWFLPPNARRAGATRGCDYCLSRKNSLPVPKGKVALVAVVLVTSDQSVGLPVRELACCNRTVPVLLQLSVRFPPLAATLVNCNCGAVLTL